MHSKSEKVLMALLRIALVFAGVGVGYVLSIPVASLLKSVEFFAKLNQGFLIVSGVLMVLFGIIGFIIAKPLAHLCIRVTKMAEQRLKQVPLPALVSSTIGLIAGLLIAALLSSTVSELPLVGNYMPVILSVIFGYLGLTVGYRWCDTVDGFLNVLRRNSKRGRKEAKESKEERCTEVAGETVCFKTTVHPKVLDTSVIIDGRIVEICRAGFLEGPLVITNFVLDELRHIADSSDSIKRVRGRRGLDILNELQGIDVEVVNVKIDYDDIPEVDAKLVQLAKDYNGYVVTNDFNLNKVASFQKVKTLNVNELAGAIKTVVLPGEKMRVEVVSRGKENDQGVGYLDDGTMIVVENGKHVIGKTVETTVTSVIQTNAGRMIFVRLNEHY
ncbi:MAG: TRAM domain-containing protein [Peptococcaceae bacterium]|jgi:uncharacterized protein YacL|nr:TRAM domain-containing protein [Peptococcaceae bacterium]